MSNDIDILFHYCSVEAFLNIIKSKTIRLSDIGKSNDYMETKWLLEYFEDEVIREFQANPSFYGNKVIYGLNDIDAIKFFAINEKQKLLRRSHDLFYVVCFSENGDKLSQWRGYADDGCGVSIGFSKEVLKELSEKKEPSGEEGYLELRKVVYPAKNAPPEEITKYAKEFLGYLESSLLNGDSKEIYHNDYSLDPYFALFSTTILLRNSIFYKNPAFSEEEEWRLLLNDGLSKSSTEWEYWYDKDEERPILDGVFAELFPKGLQFKSCRSKIVSFFDLSFKGYEDRIIKKFFIGPKSEIDEEDIEQLLSYYGYDSGISIEKSESTYR